MLWCSAQRLLEERYGPSDTFYEGNEDNKTRHDSRICDFDGHACSSFHFNEVRW